MTYIDMEQVTMDRAIGKLSRFINKHGWNIDWTLCATASGSLQILNTVQHERVRKAQSFGDDDYGGSVSNFIHHVFEENEILGFALVQEIIEELESKENNNDELDRIKNLFNFKDEDIFVYNSVLVGDNLIDVDTYPDDFYKDIVKEINILYINGRNMAIPLLLRKLFENIIIDILRKKYGTKELDLYYNGKQGRFHDFSLLIKNLDEKKADFTYVTSELTSDILKKINKYRERGNSNAHSIEYQSIRENIEKEKDEINHIIKLLIRIYQNV